ncbi:MAG: hypothetical protein J4F29_23460 [Candidatus Latescibacteria bacterium]|nr:hypothetical protein [Candidatus Latescibacterota bacterium]
MQALNDCIKEIRDISNISSWKEAQAKEWIIRPILDLLGWGRREIDPEHDVETGKGVETGSVDYALQINGENEVFIEAKRPRENLENHQEQLLDYSFKKGVALAILTNGISWWFYLPLKKGAWDDRKFYTINILEHDIEDIVGKLDLLLSRKNVASGKAVQHAESILESRQRKKIIKENLPEAWNKIIKNAVSPDSLLVDLLSETVAEVCGFQPADDEISGFIRSHQEKWLLSPGPEQGVLPPTTPPITTTGSQNNNQTEIPKRMQIGSESYEFSYGNEILVNTANWLIDKGHLKHTDCPIKISPRAKTRILIGSTPTHPRGNNFLAAKKLKNGLYIETHASIEQIIEYAKRLLEKYGYDPEILKIEY